MPKITDDRPAHIDPGAPADGDEHARRQAIKQTVDPGGMLLADAQSGRLALGKARVLYASAMTEHLPGRRERQEFDRELEVIEAKVMELFAMVAEDLPRATDALLNGSTEAVQALAERDLEIDALYPAIEELADREILLQQPVASDLRFLISVLRVVPELERSTTSSSTSPAGATSFSARTSRCAAGASSSTWGTSHPRCGARQSPAGASATAPPRVRWVHVMMRWTCCTPACWPSWPQAGWHSR